MIYVMSDIHGRYDEYKENENPKIAVEVLIGHGICHAIIETTVNLSTREIKQAIKRIGGDVIADIQICNQDAHLSKNQDEKIRCGGNGIFKGVPLTDEHNDISDIAREIYSKYKFDGKYILDNDRLIICQSNASTEELKKKYPDAEINPLDNWTGATNRKFGSDMADSLTGGGLHGKDLSKADVSVNIYAFLKAQALKEEVKFSCAIGDETVDCIPYEDIVNIAKEYIDSIGGFEKFAEWGLF